MKSATSLRAVGAATEIREICLTKNGLRGLIALLNTGQEDDVKYREPLTTLRDMRRLYDIRDVLHLSARKKVIVCPLPTHIHKHRSPSFSIFVTTDGIQKFRCHGASCGKEGDVIDLAGWLFMGNSYDPKDGEKVKQALTLLSGGTRINPPKPETTKAPMLANGLYKLYLPAGDAVVNYAKTRGLTRETLEKFSVGQNANWMTMPTLHGEKLIGIKMRNLNAKGKRDRFRSEAGSTAGLFGYNSVHHTTRPVAIVKGEIPVMVLSQIGILACAPTGGEGSYYKHEELLLPLAFASKRIVIGDNDRDPEVREKMQLAARRRGEIFRAPVFFPPEPFTGVDDWILARPEEALPAINR
jgi:hypothetical protein